MKTLIFCMLVGTASFNFHYSSNIGCNSTPHNNDDTMLVSNLCSFINKPLRDFVEAIKKNTFDTVANRHYTGHLASILLRINKQEWYEVIPNYMTSDSLFKQLRDNFHIGLLADSPIKCLRYIKSGDVIKECGTCPIKRSSE